MSISTPDRVLGDCGYEFAPSWSTAPGFLSDDHATIWDRTQHLQGWQHQVDSQKLFEMGYHTGAVILEIGVYGGRSAVIELLGANAGTRPGDVRPQYFGLDIDQKAFARAVPALEEFGLLEQAMFYHGPIDRFAKDLPIGPTMVFVDGSHQYPGVHHDLDCLRSVVAPGTPLLCHDYRGFEGVNKAVNEWVDAGAYRKMGQFAGSILIVATEACTGTVRGLSPESFDAVRRSLLGFVSDPSRCKGEHSELSALIQSGLCAPHSA